MWLQRLPASSPDKADDHEAGFDVSGSISVKDVRRMDRFIQFAVIAADEAIAQARWYPSTDD